jgi:hypothetical protein
MPGSLPPGGGRGERRAAWRDDGGCRPGHTEAGGETARRMRAIAAGLADAGLDVCLNETRGVLDVTATLDRPGAKASEVIVDEDDYIELRYWSQPGATPSRSPRSLSARWPRSPPRSGADLVRSCRLSVDRA